VTTSDRLHDVLTVDGFEDWLSTSPRRPTVRLVHRGANLPERLYCRPTRLGSATLADVVDHGAVVAEFRRGATIVGQSLHRVLAPVADFASALEDDITHRVQVNAYLTPRGQAGLTPHRDGHHVIAVQLQGHKRWEIEGLGAVDLRPGDRLYIPAGVEHSAATTTSPSLHLTIGIHAVTKRAIVHAALQSLDALDDPLPLGFGGADDECAASFVAEALAEVQRRLRSFDPTSLPVADLAPRRRRRGADELRHSFDAATVDVDSEVRLRAGIDAVVRADAEGVAVTFAGRTIRLPAAAGPALEQLVARDRNRVGDLADLDPVSQVVVARRLVEEGLLAAEESPSPRRSTCS
jgi:mannose-6-phosphate isomerase-like protein (cupin superfamily)